jgi:exopolysaccharide biosynthesis polyprenyl glycosylphosphotransferase
MHKSSRLALLNDVQLFLDITFLLIAFILSYRIISLFTGLYLLSKYNWVLIVYLPVWILLMNSFQMYNDTTFVYFDRVARCVLASSIISGIVTASMIFFLKDHSYSRLFLLGFINSSVLYILMERYFYCKFVKLHRGLASRNVIIIGATEIAEKFIYYVNKTNMLIHITGCVHIEGDKPFSNYPNLGNIEDLESILKDQIVDEVIFTLPKDYIGEVEKYSHLCESMGITVKMVLDIYDLKYSRNYLSSLGTLPVLTFYSVNQNKMQHIFKRGMDIIGALVGILISLPLAIFIIPAIKFDSEGPTFFGQPRVGLNGRIFKLYKFRSMGVDAEARRAELAEMNTINSGLMFKIENDPRITRVGEFLRRTSLDELPQFINVLKGDMSLVGTRPPTLDEVDKYEAHHHRRISMKPGITGMWQISGRSSIKDFDEVVKLDTYYIDNWSIWLDIKMLVKTVLVVIRKKGAA